MANLSALLQNFRKNLKTDAEPRAPRPETLNINNESSEQGNEEESYHEETINSLNGEHKKGDKKPKCHKSDKKKIKNPFGFPKNNKEPISPINTQGNNVINIVSSQNIHWGNEITYNFVPSNQRHQTEEPQEDITLSNSIQLLMEAAVTPTHEYMDYISKNLGKTWYSFFKSLGYTQGRIETVELEESRHGISEARYKLLLDWVRNDEDGTLGRLAKLLWEEGHREIVKELAIIYKNNPNK